MRAVSQKNVTFDWLFSSRINKRDNQSSETKINTCKYENNKKHRDIAYLYEMYVSVYQRLPNVYQKFTKRFL